MKTQQTRRDVLRMAGATTAAALSHGVTAPLRAAEARRVPAEAPATMIAIYLRGGIDALTTVVPYADSNLARHRPTLALGAPDSGPRSTLGLDGTFGFNPNLRELHALYEQGLCVPIVAVGSTHDTRSHFDAQDFMERGAPGNKLVGSGWLNRYLQATRTRNDANLRAVSLQPLLPRSLRGDYPVLAKPEQGADQAMNLYSKLYMPGEERRSSGGSGNSGKEVKQAIEQFGAQTIEQLWELTQVLENSPPPQARYPQSGFARQMRDIAKLIKSQRGLEVTAIDYGGWDHHVNLGPLDGQLGRQLADVSASIGAFAEDLGVEQMQRTMIVIMSEFGRTVKENDNQGTDHGHGGIMLLVGGKLQGKKVYGKWSGLDDKDLYQGRDLPVHTDFRLVFAELLDGVFGFDGLKRKLFFDFEPQQEHLSFMMS